MAALDPEQGGIPPLPPPSPPPPPLPRRAALSAPLAALLPMNLGAAAPARRPRPAAPPAGGLAEAIPPEPPTA